MSSWVVVAAKPGEDRRAVTNVRAQFRFYQPLFYDRRLKLRRPLFGRYFFVDLGKDEQRWGAIRSTRGILYVLCNNSEWSFIPYYEITKLRKLENQHGIIDLPEPDQLRWPYLFEKYPRCPKLQPAVWEPRPGDRVRIEDGGFIGEIGIYEGMTIQQREAVTLSWLGRILVPKHQLSKAPEEVVEAELV